MSELEPVLGLLGAHESLQRPRLGVLLRQRGAALPIKAAGRLSARNVFM